MVALVGGLWASYSAWQLLQIRTLFRKGYQFKSRRNTFTVVYSDPRWMGCIFLEAAIEINTSRDPRNQTAEWRYWRAEAIHFHLQNPNCRKVMGRQERDLWLLFFLKLILIDISQDSKSFSDLNPNKELSKGSDYNHTLQIKLTKVFLVKIYYCQPNFLI